MGVSTGNDYAFVTQLTNAYARAQIEQHYGRDALFYTLGLGLSDLDSDQSSAARMVLNPSGNNWTVQNYWNQFLTLTAGNSMRIGNRNNTKTITRADDGITASNYVNEYFSADNSSDLQQAFPGNCRGNSIFSPVTILLILIPAVQNFLDMFLLRIKLANICRSKMLMVWFMVATCIMVPLFARNLKDAVDYLGNLNLEDAYVYQYVQSVMVRLSIDQDTAVDLIENAFETRTDFLY